jgi:hypothetical protein
MATIIQAVIWLLVFGALYLIINWGLQRLGLPDPFNKVLDWILIVSVVVCVVNVVLMVVGHPIFHLPRLFF